VRVEIPSLTALRGLAALLVVFYHFHDLRLAPEFTHLTLAISKGYLAVDFFFLLSGFIMLHVYGEDFRERVRQDGYLRFLWARLASIYPMNVISLAAFIALEVVAASLNVLNHDGNTPFTEGNSVANIVRAVLLLQIADEPGPLAWNRPSWSISAEWLVYLVFPFVAWLLSLRTRLATAALLITAFALILAAYYDRETLLFVKGWWAFCRCLGGVIFGGALYLLYRRALELRIGTSDAGLLVAAAATLFAMHVGLADIFVIPLFACTIVAAALNAGWGKAVLNSAIPRFLGDISYSVYMVHFMVLAATRLLLTNAFGIDNFSEMNSPQFYGTIMAVIGVKIALSTLTYRFAETPARRAARVFARRLVSGRAA
jgi:peptidoglycan/LPS O-acetylase OafA/YrhL